MSPSPRGTGGCLSHQGLSRRCCGGVSGQPPLDRAALMLRWHASVAAQSLSFCSHLIAWPVVVTWVRPRASTHRDLPASVRGFDVRYLRTLR